MVINCDECVMRSLACKECVISVLLDSPQRSSWEDSENGGSASELVLHDEEHRALEVLADAGLAPRLRLLPAVNSEHAPSEGEIKVSRAG